MTINQMMIRMTDVEILAEVENQINLCRVKAKNAKTAAWRRAWIRRGAAMKAMIIAVRQLGEAAESNAKAFDAAMDGSGTSSLSEASGSPGRSEAKDKSVIIYLTNHQNPYKIWLPRGFEFLSGFPERLRRERRILTVQAFFDESGSRGQDALMTMCGLYGPARLFAAVADDWDKTLRARHPGAIRYFKMSEATSLSGEFQHWKPENRDAKVQQLAKVINRDDLFQIAAAIDLAQYEKLVEHWEKLPGKHAMTHPWMMLFMLVLKSTINKAVNDGWNRPIEIIFDEQSYYRPSALRDFNFVRGFETEPHRKAVLPLQPWFRSDLDFVVLQAADLLAGELRLLATEAKNPTLRFMADDLCPKLSANSIFHFIDEEQIQRFNNDLRKKFPWIYGA